MNSQIFKRRVYYQALFFALAPPVAAAVTVPQGWHQPLSAAVKVAKAQPTQPTSFAVPASATLTQAQFGWYQPLSKSAPVAQANPGNAFVPFNTAQVVQTVVKGWYGQTSTAVRVATVQPTQPTSFAVPASVAPPAQTPGQFGWWANLSKAVPVAQAKPGNTFVPFNTTQVVISPQTVPLNYDAGSVQQRVVYYQSSFQVLRPIAAAPTNTITGIAWHQPLSYVVKGATANHTLPTQFAAPYQNTIVGIAWHRWLDAVNGGVKNATPQLTQPFVPFNTRQVNSITGMGWFQPLGIAAPVAQAKPGNIFTPLNTTQITNFVTAFGWYAPLSRPAPVAQAQHGNTFVPLDTRQVNSITGIGWYQNLSRPAPVAIAQAGFSFVPFNTRQVVTVQVAFDPFVKKRSKPKRDRIRDELEIKYKRRLAIEEAFWPPTTYELPPYRLPEHVKPAPDVSDLANVIMQVQQMRAAQARQQEMDDEEDLMKILGEEYGIKDV